VGTGARLRVQPAILQGVLSPDDFDHTAQFVVEHSYGAGADARLRERALAEFRACPPIVIHGDFAACDAFDLMPRLGEIRAPTLVVCGRQDQMTPVKYSEFLAANIPDARLVIVENAGHSVMLEQPEQLNQALAEFVRAI
jgi:pimeloyl-ACP methyl ester carboxylesterase